MGERGLEILKGGVTCVNPSLCRKVIGGSVEGGRGDLPSSRINSPLRGMRRCSERREETARVNDKDTRGH